MREDLKQTNQRTRKLMTMNKALHSKNGVDRLCVSRKEEGSGLDCTDDNLDVSIQRLTDYIRNCSGRLITVPRNNTDKTTIN